MSAEAGSTKREIYEIGLNIERFIGSYFTKGSDVASVNLEVTFKNIKANKISWELHHITSVKVVNEKDGLSVMGLDRNGEEIMLFGKDDEGNIINPTTIYDNLLSNEKFGIDENPLKTIQFAPSKENYIRKTFSPDTSYARTVADFKVRFYFKDRNGILSHKDIKRVVLEGDQVYGFDHARKKHSIYTTITVKSGDNKEPETIITAPIGMIENHHNASFTDLLLTEISRIIRRSPILSKLRRK